MSKRTELQQLIAAKVYTENKVEQIWVREDPNAWIFDFRKILMNGRASDLITDVFYEAYKDHYPFQLCALEIAGVPLVTALMTKFYQRGHTDINAFFIRKSRKKDGLMRMIEGEVQPEKKIILVDDIINSGNSFWRQIEVLEPLGYRVDTVWSILRFRDENFYTRFYNRNITVDSLFSLNDLGNVIGSHIKNLPPRDEQPTPMPFTVEWTFRSKNPSLNYVLQKSQPVLDEDKIYYGADNCTFWALNQNDGSVAWQYTVGRASNKKSIFSSPAIHKNSVIFGSYDGNVYCLNRHTGKPEWIYMEADWVGSSPAIAPELGLVFIGLEYGLIGKRGGLVALNAHTGEQVWLDRTHIGLTHSSPLYISGSQEVVIGSNDGIVRLHDARTGVCKWKFQTFGGAHQSDVFWEGFGKGEIKASFAYSPKHDYLIFGTTDSFIYILDRKTGHLVKHFKCDFSVYSTPYIYKDTAYVTSTDKHLRCIDLNNLALVFEKRVDSARLFSTPTVIEDRLYIGTNAARLHELDPATGNPLGYFQAVERITNTVVHNPKTDMYFLPTYANEIIALRRTADPVSAAHTTESPDNSQSGT